MRRVSFLGSSAALALAGCGGRALQTLPLSNARASAQAGSRTAKLRLVPATPAPIPAKVLKDPFVGEGWRYAGSTPPNAAWMLAQGQTLAIAAYPALFGVLGTIAGGDGKTTFKLPNVPFGFVIAVAGVPMVSPQSFVQAGRASTADATLAAGALPAPLKPATSPPLPAPFANGPHAAVPVPLSADRASGYARALQQLGANARATITPANRFALAQAVGAAIDGRTDVAGAVRAVASQLSPREAQAIVALNDATIRTFNSRWQGTVVGDDSRFAAASVLVANTLTRDEARAIARREFASGS